MNMIHRLTLLLLLTFTSACNSGIHGFSVVNDTDHAITNVIVQEPGYTCHPMDVRPNTASGTIHGLPGRLPTTATLSWKDTHSDLDHSVAFEDIHALASGLGRSVDEIEFIINGPGAAAIAFRVPDGPVLTKRIIPNEPPVQARIRAAQEGLAKHARSGATSGFDAFLDRGATLNPHSCLHPIPLKEAVLSRKPGTVDALLALGATPELPSRRFSALVQAIHVREETIAELLIERGADLDFSVANRTPLIEAVAEDLTSIVTILIAEGADLDQTAMSEFPLIAAIRRGNRPIVDILLESGADASSLFLGRTLPDMARKWGHDQLAAHIDTWIDLYDLRHALPSRAESFVLRQIDLGRTPTLVQPGNERFIDGVYEPPDRSMQVRFPPSFGGSTEIAEFWEEGAATRESRFFTSNGIIGVLVAQRLEPEHDQQEDVLDAVRTGRENLNRYLDAPINPSRVQFGGRTVLLHSILNEEYDDIAFPVGIGTSSPIAPHTTIGVSAFFIQAQDLIQLSIIFPLDNEPDDQNARSLGERLMSDFLEGIAPKFTT